jgi:hypothetical protein
MSQQITTAFVDQFTANIMMLSQQKGSRLRSAVRNETQRGDKAFYDQIDEVAAQKVTSRHSDTPQIDTPHARRAVNILPYVWADLIDDWDKVMLLKDPRSEYAQNGAWAMGRAMDEAIIEAATGTALTGHEGTTSTSLPASQQIAVTVGAASGVTNAGLNVDKLIEAKLILDKEEVDPSQPRYIVCSAQQIADLLNETEVTSRDFNTVQALVRGQVDSFMGFNFIRTELLTLNSSTDIRTCFAFSRQGLLLAVGQDIQGRITERDDKNYATQVWCRMTIGATRMEEEQVVEIPCDESPLT